MEEEAGPPDAKRQKLSLSKEEGNILPKEVLLKIFGHLSKPDLVRSVGMVCKYWKEIAMDSSLWHEVQLSGFVGDDPGRVTKVIEGMTQLKRFKAQWVRPCEPDVYLDAIGTQLEVLDLDSLTLQEEPLSRLAARCPNLKQVCIRRCSMAGGSRHPLDIFSQCPKLQSISLEEIKGTTRIDPSTPRSWDKLEEVDINTDLPSSDAEVKVLVERVGSQLVKLSAKRLLVPRSYARISQCSNLQELHLMQNTSMTDSCLLNGLSSLKNLHKLSLRGASYLTPEAMRHFLQRPYEFRHLKFLDLYHNLGMNDNCMSILANNCPRLTHLILDGCQSFTFAGLKNAVRDLSDLRKLNVIHSKVSTVNEGQRKELQALNPRLKVEWKGCTLAPRYLVWSPPSTRKYENMFQSERGQRALKFASMRMQPVVCVEKVRFHKQ